MTKDKNLTPDDYLDRALNAYVSNNLEESIECCNKALDIDPQNERAYYIRGYTKWTNGNYDEAIADFDIAIKINPKYEGPYYSRGDIKSLKEDNDGAIADYDMAIQINPKSEDTYYHRGLAKRKKGDNNGAIADFDKVIQLNPQHETVYCLRGIAKSEIGDYDGEIADYDKVIQINPQHEVAHYFRGTAKEKKGDYDGAIADIDIAIQINPHEEAYYRRGFIKAQTGDLSGAIADFDKVIEINPQHTEAPQRRSIVKSQLENNEKAEKDGPPTKDIESDTRSIGTDTQRPVLDILLFQRDVYLLLAMMLADEAISEISEFQDIATDNYENEVKRLLVLTAVSARQLMESTKNKTKKKICGKLHTHDDSEQTVLSKLIFWKACNSIIHAKDIIPYDDIAQNASEEKIPERRCYKGTITVHSQYQGKREVAEINGQDYAKYCIMLGKEHLNGKL